MCTSIYSIGIHWELLVEFSYDPIFTTPSPRNNCSVYMYSLTTRIRFLTNWNLIHATTTILTVSLSSVFHPWLL